MPHSALEHYWSGDFLAANAFIGLHLVGALLLGMLMGYERSYQGRAAGMRTYGLVCMASTALTVFVGFAPLWYGGAGGGPADATRVVQGVVSGIGFLCAGVIMKHGLNIRGLTTAASIWAVAAIGVLLGVGFYAAALLLALLCTLSLPMLRQLEAKLPGRATLDVSEARGYRVLSDGLAITFANDQPVWRFAVVAMERSRAVSPALLAEELAGTAGIASFGITPMRS